jgi:NADH-quinone oxidoreductase subunit L
VTEVGLAVLVVAAPFAAALLLTVLPSLRRTGRPAGAVALAGAGVALGAAVVLAAGLWRGTRPPETLATAVWLPQAGPEPLATVGVWVDPLSTSMAVLVALVAFLVQLYSLGYLADESPGSRSSRSPCWGSSSRRTSSRCSSSGSWWVSAPTS